LTKVQTTGRKLTAIADLIGRGRLKIYNVAGVQFVSRREALALERQTPGPKPGGKKKAKV
jgi:hypothetical protein